MNFCVNCGIKLPEIQVKHCPGCGYLIHPDGLQKDPTPKARREAALITLCVMTILGSIVGMLKALAIELVYSSEYIFSNNNYHFGYLSLVFNLGTLAAAIIMLMGRRTGYKIYLISQCANILVVLLWLFLPPMFSLSSTYQESMYYASRQLSPFYVWATAATVIPSVVFIILYTVLVKKHLN